MSEITPGWRKRVAAVGAVGINVNGRNLTARQADEIKEAGYLLGVYTINDPRLAQLLVGMGADWVITDTPDVIIAAIGS